MKYSKLKLLEKKLNHISNGQLTLILFVSLGVSAPWIISMIFPFYVILKDKGKTKPKIR